MQDDLEGCKRLYFLVLLLLLSICLLICPRLGADWINDKNIGLLEVEVIGVEKRVLLFVEVQMVAREDTVVLLINWLLLVSEDFARDEALRFGLLEELLFDLHVELGELLVVLARLLLRDRKDMLDVVDVVVDRVGKADVDG